MNKFKLLQAIWVMLTLGTLANFQEGYQVFDTLWLWWGALLYVGGGAVLVGIIKDL